MNLEKLATALAALGLAMVAVGLLWWLSFYDKVAQAAGGHLSRFAVCLVDGSGKCGIIEGVAAFFGYTPYSPVLLVTGLSFMLVGALLSYATQH